MRSFSVGITRARLVTLKRKLLKLLSLGAFLNQPGQVGSFKTLKMSAMPIFVRFNFNANIANFVRLKFLAISCGKPAFLNRADNMC